jgi:hypothetical protein
MVPRKYTDEQKREALALYKEHGPGEQGPGKVDQGRAEGSLSVWD